MRKFHFAPVAALLVACAALGSVTGCAGTKAAYQEAQSLDEYAYVVTEHYAALVKQGADLAAKPGTPRAAIDAMKKADKAAHDIIVGTSTSPGLKQLVDAYTAIKNADTQEALQLAVNDAVLKLADLLRSIKAAGGGS